jgi:PqqA peptide cyclase
MLAGDAAATDPVCTLSPMHGVVEEITHRISSLDGSQPAWVYRIDPVTPVTN